jgi:hypothetical protein
MRAGQAGVPMAHIRSRLRLVQYRSACHFYEV